MFSYMWTVLLQYSNSLSQKISIKELKYFSSNLIFDTEAVSFNSVYYIAPDIPMQVRKQ